MDLPTIRSVLNPTTREALPRWQSGTAWLAGGTWLFSEPQASLHTLVDLLALGWPAIEQLPGHLRLGATCTLATIESLAAPADWLAAPLFGHCARALLGSFKVRHVATVGGNICLALPAAPIVALTVALQGIAWTWRSDGTDRHLPMREFVLGPQQTALQPGEVLRAVEIPLTALRRRAVCRQISLTAQGRSGALLISTRDPSGPFALTITASTIRPFVLNWRAPPTAEALDTAIAGLPDAVWLDDVHGRPDWRRHVTRVLAVQSLEELCR